MGEAEDIVVVENFEMFKIRVEDTKDDSAAS